MPKTLTTNELTVLGRVDILCDALEKDYKNDNIRLHESSLRDEMHYSPYHEEALAAIENGTANLNKFKSYEGRKYHKIVMQEYDDMGQYATHQYKDSSVHAFIDKKTGDVFKPAGWQGPAKHARFNLLDDNSYEECIHQASWAGGYLYMR